MTTEINAFVKAINEQQEEQRLFQLFNGLEEGYSVQRSHLLYEFERKRSGKSLEEM